MEADVQCGDCLDEYFGKTKLPRLRSYPICRAKILHFFILVIHLASCTINIGASRKWCGRNFLYAGYIDFIDLSIYVVSHNGGKTNLLTTLMLKRVRDITTDVNSYSSRHLQLRARRTSDIRHVAFSDTVQSNWSKTSAWMTFQPAPGSNVHKLRRVFNEFWPLNTGTWKFMFLKGDTWPSSRGPGRSSTALADFSCQSLSQESSQSLASASPC